MPEPPESEVELTLLLNVVQSVEVSNPRFTEEAVGRLKVMVFPEAVMVKSEPVVEEASVWVPPLWS